MQIENITEKETFKMNNEYARKAKEYIHLILYGVDSFERCGKHPIIVMSMDIYDVLSAFTQNAVKLIPPNKITCCGRDVKIAHGENILFIAYDLQEV